MSQFRTKIRADLRVANSGLQQPMEQFGMSTGLESIVKSWGELRFWGGGMEGAIEIAQLRKEGGQHFTLSMRQQRELQAGPWMSIGPNNHSALNDKSRKR